MCWLAFSDTKILANKLMYFLGYIESDMIQIIQLCMSLKQDPFHHREALRACLPPTREQEDSITSGDILPLYGKLTLALHFFIKIVS